MLELQKFLLAHVRSRDGAQDQENAPMSPDPFQGVSYNLRGIPCTLNSYIASDRDVMSEEGGYGVSLIVSRGQTLIFLSVRVIAVHS